VAAGLGASTTMSGFATGVTILRSETQYVTVSTATGEPVRDVCITDQKPSGPDDDNFPFPGLPKTTKRISWKWRTNQPVRSLFGGHRKACA